MQKKLFLILSLTCTLIIMAGCGKKDEKTTHTTISAIEAKKMMDENRDIIILDVRSQEEYQEGHIEGAILTSGASAPFQLSK
ncbi:rhodanese-like domain-containing protein [Anaerocolumna aminovalerica]|uniref:rhodanese-like domain-containing protein n=1 Tax=Anaerocolumna aminovalerica TaxID=1527 RepID=UPI000BE3BCF1|nr:rhodanese-like domain-containing protein [Anaerocolumna aminovalerica]